MKIAYVVNGGRDNALRHYAQQLGVKYAVANSGGNRNRRSRGNYTPEWDYVNMAELKKELATFGLEWVVLEGVGCIDGVKLGLPNRDEEIAHFCTLLESMSKAGVEVCCYNWMPIWGWYRTNVNIKIDGDALVTGFDIDDVKDYPIHELGPITKRQLWDNLEYFLKKVVPVAERCKVKLAIHPDDPPIDSIGGIDRILTSADAMMQVCELVPSAFNGITLCQGNFAAMEEDVPAQIRRFGKAGKLFFAHFRDVIGDRNHFIECFHHVGRTDMHEAMKAYYEIDFQGVMRPDHVPTMYGDDNSNPSYGVYGNLFATGYMVGLMESIEKELGSYQRRI